MNCLEYRRLALQDSNALPEQAKAHHDECSTCQSFARQLNGFNATLQQAMNVDVPEGLADRILFKQSFGLDRSRRRRTRTQLIVLAASFVFGLMLSLRLLVPGATALEHAVLAHVHDELDHLHENHSVSVERVNELLASLDTRASGKLDNIRYAGTCAIGKTVGAHLVLQGRSGPVTVLYLPREQVSETQRINDKTFQGLLSPGMRGSIAVIGDSDTTLEELQDIEQKMQEILQPVV